MSEAAVTRGNRTTGPRVVPAACPHDPPETATPSGDRCEECGSTYNLRACATCGHVGCCESQAGHGRAHALGAHHPVIRQVPIEDGWAWCYEEQRYIG